MSKQFWIVVAVIIVGLVGLFAFSGKKTTTTGSGSGNTPSSHVEGLGKDHVKHLEYGDYECPYCGEYFPIVKSIQAEYNTQMTFQFRNFPLTSIHQNAFAGARAAEAASDMGKFWEMHDLLYEDQDEWVDASDPTPYFNQFAQQIGLNVTTFKTDYASQQVDNVINADMAAGNALGVDATPTFYLDGKQIQVNDTTSAFQSLINAAIAKQTKTASNTTTTTSTTSAGTTAQTKE